MAPEPTRETTDTELPQPSYWPILMALSLAITMTGVVSTIWISVAGLIFLLATLTGWTLENRSRSVEEADHE